MTIVYLLIVFFLVYFTITIVSISRTEQVKRAFAGSYDGKDTAVSITKDRNETIYTEGENKVDLSNYDKFIIYGKSLQRVGLPDGVFVYTKPLEEGEDIYSICHRFVVFKYDNQRLAKEHPEIKNLVEGFKARKVETIFETNLIENEFKKRMGQLLEADNDIPDKNKDECVEKLWEKYKFANDYYKNEDKLIVSITYKKGECKDYSFHSPKYLHGVVRYKSVS